MMRPICFTEQLASLVDQSNYFLILVPEPARTSSATRPTNLHTQALNVPNPRFART